MEFGAIQISATALIAFLITAIVWLAQRLKQKNRQLKCALTQLQASKNELAGRREPIIAAEPAPPCIVPQPEPIASNTSHDTIDAFLWQHLGDIFLWKHLANPQPAPRPLEVAHFDPASIPAGMCAPAILGQLLESARPFTGLVVLVGVDRAQPRRSNSSIETFISGLLGPADFASRRSDEEFLLICPGLTGPEAQRRLNEISERLWSFQLRGQGAFSLLFSWGGIGVAGQPLSEAIASATDRMQQTKRSRLTFFNRKAG